MMDQPKPIEPETYSHDYFLTDCEGHEEYLRTGGRALPVRLEQAVTMVQGVQGLRVLDLGAGRGEVVRYCLDRGAAAMGVDYARAALELARRILPPERPPLVRAHAGHLPFAEGSFDLVFMLDLVEHLLPDELAATYAEVWRVLAPGGRVIVHTMPNRWYYVYGYPLFRAVQGLRGRRLPRNPRHRSFEQHVHVNEQTVLSLRRGLRAAGFGPRVELRSIQSYAEESSPLVRQAMRFLASVPPFSWTFCNDIFAEGVKVTAPGPHSV